jgi:hypothetical protein
MKITPLECDRFENLWKMVPIFYAKILAQNMWALAPNIGAE